MKIPSSLRPLLDALPDAKSPCLTCQYAVKYNEGDRREWAYVACDAGWFDDAVTEASLEAYGHHFGLSIRKFTSICPHVYEGSQIMLIAYVSSQDSERVLTTMTRSTMELLEAVVSTLHCKIVSIDDAP